MYQYNDNYGRYCETIRSTCQERDPCTECQAYLDSLHVMTDEKML